MDAIWKDFKRLITTIVEDHITSKLEFNRTRRSNPRITTKVKRLLRRRQQALHLARHTTSAGDQSRCRRLEVAAQREIKNPRDQYPDETQWGEL